MQLNYPIASDAELILIVDLLFMYVSFKIDSIKSILGLSIKQTIDFKFWESTKILKVIGKIEYE